MLGELIRIFNYNLDENVSNNDLKKVLIDELFLIVHCHIKSYQLLNDAKKGIFDMEKAWNARKKRLSCTMMLLCDCLNLK